MENSGAMYEKPTITVMDEDQVLAAFQMTAAQISAAGCWWMSCDATLAECNAAFGNKTPRPLIGYGTVNDPVAPF
jgi:hypothetical protein